MSEFRRLKRVVEPVDQLEFMASKIVGKILEKAMDGNMQASRLSLQIMGVIGKQGTRATLEEDGAEENAITKIKFRTEARKKNTEEYKR